MKPKDYLLSIGAIDKVTRGRLSLENIEKCKAAAAKGIQIDGYVISKPKSDTPAPVQVEKVKPSTEKVIADIGEPRYDEREWDAYRMQDGKRIPVGIRTSCNTCHNALSFHFCGDPKVWADFQTEAKVYFAQKKS